MLVSATFPRPTVDPRPFLDPGTTLDPTPTVDPGTTVAPTPTLDRAGALDPALRLGPKAGTRPSCLALPRRDPLVRNGIERASTVRTTAAAMRGRVLTSPIVVGWETVILAEP